MSAWTPSALPRLTVTVISPGLGLPAMTSAASVGSVVLSRRPSVACSRSARDASARCSCSRTLEVGHLLAQGLVLGPHAAQRDVAVPGAADAAEDAGRAALNAGEHAERDALEDRHAGLRLHLRGDQDEVADHHGAEENPGTLAVRRAGGEVDHGNSEF